MANRDSLPIIVFDFDGVVCDSTYECLVTSWNAWQKWNSNEDLRADLSSFSDEEKALFSRLRPRVRGAGEYYVVQRAMAEKIEIPDQHTYDLLVAKWSDQVSLFKKKFYDVRSQFRERDLESWIKLHVVYQEIIVLMKILSASNQLYIATLKDGSSVRSILSYFGVKVSDERMYDESTISTKLEALDSIANRLSIKKRDIIFVDDNVTHLFDPFSQGYSVYLTVWGNSLREYEDMALERGICIFHSVDDLTLFMQKIKLIPNFDC